MSAPVISCDRSVMGGAPVFRGSRVPMQTLLDHLEAGESMDDFLLGECVDWRLARQGRQSAA